jgi:hypothetical protein
VVKFTKDILRSEPPLSLVRRIAWLLLPVFVIWGAVLRFSLPLAPFADADYYGYLGPAIVTLSGGTFKHLISREFVYPLFVLVTLFVGGDFHALPICQHLLGLATAVFLFAAWQELLALNPSHSIRDYKQKPGHRKFKLFAAAIASECLGLLLASLYLGWRETIFLEHTIRPEGIFPFFAATSIWLNLRFIRFFWRERQVYVASIIGAVHLFVSGVLLLLRPSFGLATIFINVPLAIAVWQQSRQKLHLFVQPTAIAIIAVLLLLFLPEYVLRRHDRLAARLLPSIRLYTHANLVLHEMEKDLAPGNQPRYDRTMLQAIHDRLAAAYAAAQSPQNRPWPKLGFNPDYMYLEKRVFEPFYSISDRTKDQELRRFCNHYFFCAALHQPGPMAAKIGLQLTFFYSFDTRFPALGSWLHSNQTAASINDLYARELRSFEHPSHLRQKMEGLDIGRRHLAECRRLAKSGMPVRDSIFANNLRECIRAVYTWVAVAALGLALLCLTLPRVRASCYLNAGSTLLLYSYNLGNCLTIATVFYLGNPRYLNGQEAFTMFAEFAGLLLIFGTLHSIAVGSRTRRT